MLLEGIFVFVAAFLVSAFAGLAALLRSPSPLTIRSAVTSFLNCGSMGLAVSLVWYSQFKDNPYVLVGMCGMAGLGGLATVEWLVESLKKFGLLGKVAEFGSVPPKKGEDEEKRGSS